MKFATKTITPKQKMYLRGLANGIQKRHLLGKEELDASFINSLDVALKANELIKVGLLQSSSQSAKDVALALSSALQAEIVQVVGRVIVLYRHNPKDPKIQLP